MKIRQKSVCDNCRRRKLGCDGMRPECTQCKWSQQACPGYPDPWTFMPPQVSGSRDAQYNLSSADLAAKPASIIDTGLSNANDIQPDHRDHPNIVTNPPFEDPSGNDFDRYVARIIECYMPVVEQGRADSNPVDSQPRICGSWVEVMPKMKNDRHPENTMELAVRAFALSLDQTGQDTSTAYRNIFHAYECALGSLRRHLARPACQFQADIAIAIMCLGLAEVRFFLKSTAILT
ncbi:Zn(II)2Cys6 transcription factor domain-containing protein [Aspergillus fijiensis CBS 313.89]|uniref:Zn(2)-C6 fungal-type domain-containing protein n=1 Tax=Aspergillus fijiensis CBS 313.89 TaxID=1448319 RepID=A0A8G1RWC0_9EURO|nr:uncharacterized protein BO72DRAFT_25076 [Aspergillus fijiensis CBS 313.89]RAK79947.1 hypothetical protein BO72DRAFT_25076 [Aspergillus fijiensis CBS 313.89]